MDYCERALLSGSKADDQKSSAPGVFFESCFVVFEADDDDGGGGVHGNAERPRKEGKKKGWLWGRSCLGEGRVARVVVVRIEYGMTKEAVKPREEKRSWR